MPDYCFSGIEVFNKGYSTKDYVDSIKLTHNTNLALVSGSDIHLLRHIGTCPVFSFYDIDTIENYVDELTISKPILRTLIGWKDMKHE